MPDVIQQLRGLFSRNQRIAVLSGAGMSTESGIPDFRSEQGLWQDPRVVSMMTERYLHAHPDNFWREFKRVFMNEEYRHAKPNAGHLALAQLEQMGKQVQIFTQNVDGLHQAAGSTDVHELHGSIYYAECPRGHGRYDADYLLEQEVPRCSFREADGQPCNAVLEPDVVLFGQMVKGFEEAFYGVLRSELLLVLGTSLTVDPVASLPQYLIKGHHHLVVINLEETYIDDKADLIIRAKVGETLAAALRI
ncbi:NAD-dependent protein deacylase [Sulfoacidibacillus thermotolerans]|uniref:protein acetyllysine N-acetyltransferase n=1 Tax=Sulfoacidibacillus thermotolerans TaxID=1765684 RepID=A0A2U3D800_SULT2|nr:NAD-dependent protein deacylase [Sulfoacidibacillus thermotolerans]PWI57391.1 NAD-dependent protein deacylase [Sulfoacidibacillus thermotolerans]